MVCSAATSATGGVDSTECVANKGGGALKTITTIVATGSTGSRHRLPQQRVGAYGCEFDFRRTTDEKADDVAVKQEHSKNAANTKVFEAE